MYSYLYIFAKNNLFDLEEREREIEGGRKKGREGERERGGGRERKREREGGERVKGR